MNRNKALPGIPIIRHQIFNAAGMSLLVFTSALLFLNLILGALLSSHFWLSLCLAALVLGGSAVIIQSGYFSNLASKCALICISLLTSVTAILMAHLFFISAIEHFLSFASFKQPGAVVKVVSLPRFISLEWDKAHSRTLLVFDESDVFDDAGHFRAKQWWQQVEEKDRSLAACDWTSTKVSAHFYRVTFFCDNPYPGPSAPMP